MRITEIKQEQKQKKILCAGDILYDFISATRGAGLKNSEHFEKKPGGSPFNISIGLARLGIPVGFLVKIGSDEFGEALREFLVKEGVSTEYLLDGAGRNTTLAMAAVDSAGKVEFHFYRENAADVSLSVAELPDINPEKISVYQFGSICLADDPVGESLMHVYEMAKKKGILTVLDPNVRPLYVNDRPVYRERVLRIIKDVNILKLSDDDLFWLAGTNKDIEKCLAQLEINPAGLVIVTEGRRGARAFWQGKAFSVPGREIEVAETTGCGDSFLAGVISKLADGRVKFDSMTPEFLQETLTWATACAAIVASRYGAANSMPYAKEVAEFLAKT